MDFIQAGRAADDPAWNALFTLLVSMDADFAKEWRRRQECAECSVKHLRALTDVDWSRLRSAVIAAPPGQEHLLLRPPGGIRYGKRARFLLGEITKKKQALLRQTQCV